MIIDFWDKDTLIQRFIDLYNLSGTQICNIISNKYYRRREEEILQEENNKVVTGERHSTPAAGQKCPADVLCH